MNTDLFYILFNIIHVCNTYIHTYISFNSNQNPGRLIFISDGCCLIRICVHTKLVGVSRVVQYLVICLQNGQRIITTLSEALQISMCLNRVNLLTIQDSGSRCLNISSNFENSSSDTFSKHILIKSTTFATISLKTPR